MTQIIINNDIINTIFNACDKCGINETGGRLLGNITVEDNALNINVCGIISAGPNARATPVSLFQDGDYQERVFRRIEQVYPWIEHVGNWHTHHINGLKTLSDGDIGTYRRTVNHPNYNLDIFLALLVTSKYDSIDRGGRYGFKCFLFRKGGNGFTETTKVIIRNGQSIALC